MKKEQFKIQIQGIDCCLYGLYGKEIGYVMLIYASACIELMIINIMCVW